MSLALDDTCFGPQSGVGPLRFRGPTRPRRTPAVGTRRAWQRLVAALVFALFAAGCASASDSATNVDPNDADSAAAEATAIPVPADDGAADAAIAGLDGNPPPEPANADPDTTARAFVQSTFNIDPEPSWVQCMVAETERDEVLATALQTPSVALGQVDDSQMRALTTAMNGCIETISLADWATQAIGPRGEVNDTAPPCFVESFDDPESGDVLFYNFVALNYQFRLEPSGVDNLIDTLTTCTPIAALTDFFAGQAELAANYETVVDRDCLNDALSPVEVSASFWDVFVNGTTPAVDFITPYAEDCTSSPSSDLAATVPDDFEPWSGTGVLATVVPSARNGVYDAAPPMSIDPDASYEAIISTGGGEIRVRLLVDSAPIAVNNFVSLARDGYYDGTVFHRVLDGFMAQGGDPTGLGTGGPGYQFVDEFDGGQAIDRAGILAMANTGADSNGSQFFITFAEADYLTGMHTAFGEVIEGLEIVDAIERRDPAAPTSRGQAIDSVVIIES